MASFNVYEKILATEKVTLVQVFPTFEQANEWAEDMMAIWEEDRAYKIVEEDIDAQVMLDAFVNRLLTS